MITKQIEIARILEELKNKLSEKYSIDYDEINSIMADTENTMMEILDAPAYNRINDTPIRLMPSDRQDSKYMVMAYDYKQYAWRNADIYGNTDMECMNVARIVFGNSDSLDNELKIEIDYGT